MHICDTCQKHMQKNTSFIHTATWVHGLDDIWKGFDRGLGREPVILLEIGCTWPYSYSCQARSVGDGLFDHLVHSAQKGCQNGYLYDTRHKRQKRQDTQQRSP